MANSILPVSNNKRMRKINSNDYQEVYTDEMSSSLRNKGIDAAEKVLTDTRVIGAVADNMSSILNIASEIVMIKGSVIETNNKLSIMDKEIEKLQVSADNYVRCEKEKRQLIESKADSTIDILDKLTMAIKDSNDSDEVKKLVIDTFSKAIDKVWEDGK